MGWEDCMKRDLVGVGVENEGWGVENEGWGVENEGWGSRE